MKIKLFVSADNLQPFLTGKSETFFATVYNQPSYNVEIEVDTDTMNFGTTPRGGSTFYVLSKKNTQRVIPLLSKKSK